MNIRIGAYDVDIEAKRITDFDFSCESTEAVVHVLELAARYATEMLQKEGYSGTAFRYAQITESLHDALESRGYYD